MPSPFDGLTDAELLAELERRKQLQNQPPPPSETPDFTGLVQTAKNILTAACDQNRWDEDAEHYIFQAAMKAVYGPDYFKWHNKKFRT